MEIESHVSAPFHVTLTADFFDAEGNPRYQDLGLSLFSQQSGISVGRFAEHHPEIRSDQLSGSNGVIVLTPRVTANSLEGCRDLLAIGRFGVGYDSVDVSACTANDILLFITSGAVDRSVAEATVGWMIALTHHFRIKDHLVRDARWNARSLYMGSELRERTLGVVGFGGIGKSLVRLLSGFSMNQPLVFDPFASTQQFADYGVRGVSLDELLRNSDFVSLHCPLNEQTRGLIGKRELSLMKPSAYLINTARGGIVDELALVNALESHQIAGAALDCFEGEPLTAAPRLASFDNVLLAPHCIAWTHELFRDIGRAACQGMIDLATGVIPRGVVNPEVLDQAGFKDKWKRLVPVNFA